MTILAASDETEPYSGLVFDEGPENRARMYSRALWG
jgi:hypothetical protein